jgi:hypothetical protein
LTVWIVEAILALTVKQQEREMHKAKWLTIGLINAVCWGGLVAWFSLFFGFMVFAFWIMIGIKIAMAPEAEIAKIKQDRLDKEQIKKYKHQKELQEAKAFFG